MLSSEQGVYVAESVAAKNMKQAKGRYRVYEVDDDEVILYSNYTFVFYYNLDHENSCYRVTVIFSVTL